MQQVHVGDRPGQSLSVPPVPTAGPETYLEVSEGLLGRQRLAVIHRGLPSYQPDGDSDRGDSEIEDGT